MIPPFLHGDNKLLALLMWLTACLLCLVLKYNNVVACYFYLLEKGGVPSPIACKSVSALKNAEMLPLFLLAVHPATHPSLVLSSRRDRVHL